MQQKTDILLHMQQTICYYFAGGINVGMQNSICRTLFISQKYSELICVPPLSFIAILERSTLIFSNCIVECTASNTSQFFLANPPYFPTNIIQKLARYFYFSFLFHGQVRFCSRLILSLCLAPVQFFHSKTSLSIFAP